MYQKENNVALIFSECFFPLSLFTFSMSVSSLSPSLHFQCLINFHMVSEPPSSRHFFLVILVFNFFFPLHLVAAQPVWADFLLLFSTSINSTHQHFLLGISSNTTTTYLIIIIFIHIYSLVLVVFGLAAQILEVIFV